MRYKITIRLCSEDLEILETIKNSLPGSSELFAKGQPIRPQSKFLAEQNVLIVYSESADRIDEPMIIREVEALNHVSPNVKKELIISSVSDCDQYGFELSQHLVQCLGISGFSIQVSGVFL